MRGRRRRRRRRRTPASTSPDRVPRIPDRRSVSSVPNPSISTSSLTSPSAVGQSLNAGNSPSVSDGAPSVVQAGRDEHRDGERVTAPTNPVGKSGPEHGLGGHRVPVLGRPPGRRDLRSASRRRWRSLARIGALLRQFHAANARQYSSHGRVPPCGGGPMISTNDGSLFDPLNFFSQLISTENDTKQTVDLDRERRPARRLAGREFVRQLQVQLDRRRDQPPSTSTSPRRRK